MAPPDSCPAGQAGHRCQRPSPVRGTVAAEVTPSPKPRALPGGRGRSAEQRSMCPEQIGGSALSAEVERTGAGKSRSAKSPAKPPSALRADLDCGPEGAQRPHPRTRPRRHRHGYPGRNTAEKLDSFVSMIPRGASGPMRSPRPRSSSRRATPTSSPASNCSSTGALHRYERAAAWTALHLFPRAPRV